MWLINRKNNVDKRRLEEARKLYSREKLEVTLVKFYPKEQHH